MWCLNHKINAWKWPFNIAQWAPFDTAFKPVIGSVYQWYISYRIKWTVHTLSDSIVNLHNSIYFLHTLREESSQTNVILQYKLLAAILSAVCSVIQQSYYVLHVYYTLYDGKYDCKITLH